MHRSVLVPFLATGLVGLTLVACSSDRRTVGPGGSTEGAPGSAGGSPGTGPFGGSGGEPGGGAGSVDPTTKPLADFVGDAPVTGGSKLTKNTTLTADKSWLMKGVVYVPAGVTLTIEKGTTIFGDKGALGTLVIQPGGKIDAVGTADEPIVFTSFLKEGQKAAGDWGGVIVLGKAPINGGSNGAGGASADKTAFIEGLPASEENKYGGTNAADSSGRLAYVRIEYSGAKIGADNEINGLTFGGVGSGTQVDHIQVRHTLDDCFEFFGGTVNAKYLVCAYNQDDALDMDNGYSGKVQFFVLQQDPNVDDEMNGFEWDNDAQKSANLPITNPTVYNATLCGQNKSGGAKRKFAMLLRRNTAGTIRNVLAWGFDAALDVRDDGTQQRAKGTSTPALTVQGSQFFKFTMSGLKNGVEIPNDAFSEADWLAQNDNVLNEDPAFDCMNPEAPKFAPAKVITDKAVAPPNDGFLDANARYIGAFKDENDKWATSGRWAAWTKPGF